MTLYTYIYPDTFVILVPCQVYPDWAGSCPAGKNGSTPENLGKSGQKSHSTASMNRTVFAKMALQAAADRQVFCVHADDDMKLAFYCKVWTGPLLRYCQDICSI